MVTEIEPNVNNEYDNLEKVIVCPPTFMKIDKVINETQKQFIEKNINQEKATSQHQLFVKTLTDIGIDVIFLPEESKYPEQVFTRDIAFTIGNTVYLSKMGNKIRIGEEEVVRSYLREEEIAYKSMETGKIEGGDVLVADCKVFVGISCRTNRSAVIELQKSLKHYKVLPIKIEKKYLHLDCVFNIISSNEALVYSPAFRQKELDLLSSHFDLIEVENSEQFTMGTNILSLGEKQIISLPQNIQVNKQLLNRGYNVIEVEFSEIIKSGGSFRCCSLPLLRRSK
ncbi:N-dimethylarginine dimethylaminohydrolase [Bacillus pakistanensis]|uniref:N-dimethylarginine dimethylaminohydrolase n=1 Tax=Rossellomorea pakistanensis TaxID=992288 RepID=A0ABS2NGE8_9BACI|nr:N-dimethylarginine dimethylaminohydrolase [Bacillus pakistanensis]